MSQLKRQNDAQLQAIISQLLLLEAQLRREQKEILGQLTQKDLTIVAQRQEIDKLRRKNRKLLNRLKKITESNNRDEFGYNGDGQTDENPNNQLIYQQQIFKPQSFNNLSKKTNRHHQSLEDLCSMTNRTEFTRDLHSFLVSVSNKSNLSNSENNDSKKKAITTCNSNNQNPAMIRVATSVSQLINSSDSETSNFFNSSINNKNQNSNNLEVVNPNVASVRAMVGGRVTHKPPIAEKPRLINGSKYGKVVSTLVRPMAVAKTDSNNRQCNIVSTIHQLLEEESDATTGGSGSSEPSSPEATLKPVTPRVLKLARKFEKEASNINDFRRNNSNNSDSSPEFIRHDDRNMKAIIMDEHEVYN